MRIYVLSVLFVMLFRVSLLCGLAVMKVPALRVIPMSVPKHVNLVSHLLISTKTTLWETALCVWTVLIRVLLAIHYKAIGFGSSLLEPIKKTRAVDVWIYILLFAFMTLTMKIDTNLNHSAVSEFLPWVWISDNLHASFPNALLNFSAVFTLLTSLLVTLFFVSIGFSKAAKILKKERKSLFIEIGYAYAPLALVASVGVAFKSFFTRYFHNVVNGFIDAFDLPFHFLKPLASPDAFWLVWFNACDYIAIVWTLFLLYKRIGLITEETQKKEAIQAFFWLSLLTLVYLFITIV